MNSESSILPQDALQDQLSELNLQSLLLIYEILVDPQYKHYKAYILLQHETTCVGVSRWSRPPSILLSEFPFCRMRPPMRAGGI